MDPMGVEWKFIYTLRKNNMDTTKIPNIVVKKNPLNEQKHINFFGVHIGFRECNYFLHTRRIHVWYIYLHLP